MADDAGPGALESTARAILDSINKRDFSTTLSLLDPGYVATWPHATLPGIEAAGHEATILTAVPDTQFEIRNTVVQGHTVVVELLATGVVTGPIAIEPFEPAEPSGGSLQLLMCFVMAFNEDGRLWRETLYFDQATFAAQLGTTIRLE